MNRDDVSQCKYMALTAAGSYAACVYWESFLPLLANVVVPPCIMFFFWAIRHEYDTEEQRVPLAQRIKNALRYPSECRKFWTNMPKAQKILIAVCAALLTVTILGPFSLFLILSVVGFVWAARHPDSVMEFREKLKDLSAQIRRR